MGGYSELLVAALGIIALQFSLISLASPRAGR